MEKFVDQITLHLSGPACPVGAGHESIVLVYPYIKGLENDKTKRAT
jgi:hypothetical protein